MINQQTIDQLPSLPQVLIHILDAIQSENADYQSIAEIIRQDSAVTAKLIAAASSSYFGQEKRCDSIERALLFLGTDTVKTIAITASFKQFLGQFSAEQQQFMQLFWRRSLVAAHFAQVLATLTGYRAPDEAYLCGLLMDVGQLILLTHDQHNYLALLRDHPSDNALITAEQQHYQTDHSQLSGELLDSWGISSLMSDAVRFHHQPHVQIRDAHHLTKIINLASRLSCSATSAENIDDESLAAADSLFGLNQSLTQELRSRIDSDVDTMSNSLGINIGEPHEARQQLGLRLEELNQQAQWGRELWQAQGQAAIQQAVQRSLLLTFDINNSLLFLLDDDENLLRCQPLVDDDNEAADSHFQVPAQAGRSLVSDALLQGQALSCQESAAAGESRPLTVLDKQLLHFCGGPILVCWPLLGAADQRVGVLCFTISPEQQSLLSQRSRLIKPLCQEIAAVISARQTTAPVDNAADSEQHFSAKISEAVHEASNPLSIIRNYLQVLRIKLGDDHDANEGLDLIKGEIERVGNILLRLKDPSQPLEEPGSQQINTIIEGIASIFRDSLCISKQISLQLTLDPAVAELNGNAEHLKQILTNLLKNAVEALPPGGEISLSTEASVSVSGKVFSAITIADNGPGISDAIKQQLFSPLNTSKGEGHSGLGLSIVKKLIDDMNGSIVCRSNANTGTQFQVLLPYKNPNKKK